MGVKYIKGNVDIIAMVVAQWELTGRLNEIEYRFLLEKVEELHDSLKLIRPNSKFLMNEEVAADGLREFSIDLGGGEESVTDIGESVPADEHSSDSNAEASQPEDNYPVAETETGSEAEIEVECTGSEDAEEKRPADNCDILRRGRLKKNAVRALYYTDDCKPEAETINATTEEPEAPAGENAAEEPVVTDTTAEESEGNENSECQEEVSGPSEPEDIEEATETTYENAAAEAEEPVSSPTPEDTEDAGDAINHEPEPAKAAEPTVAADSKVVVLGEIINSGGHVLGETLQALSSHSVASTVTGKISSLRKSVGINDKYIMINELFAGDAEAYENAIGTLDSFTTLDDAMLWIYDNYDWSPDDAGTKTMMDLLVRKLS